MVVAACGGDAVLAGWVTVVAASARRAGDWVKTVRGTPMRSDRCDAKEFARELLEHLDEAERMEASDEFSALQGKRADVDIL